tara:strand:- start:422 stop:592 length:171 start_codon:yes stop_codon:yes gene_type:complete
MALASTSVVTINNPPPRIKRLEKNMIPDFSFRSLSISPGDIGEKEYDIKGLASLKK